MILPMCKMNKCTKIVLEQLHFFRLSVTFLISMGKLLRIFIRDLPEKWHLEAETRRRHTVK